MEMDWSLDYCLACDRQTAGQLYCSQLCRLADLESSAPPSAYDSEPSSPTSATAQHGAASAPSPTFANTSSTSLSPSSSAFGSRGFFLPPRFDFSAYRRSPSPIRPSSSSSSSTTSRLTSSSSRVSLDGHGGVDDGIPFQTRCELREYTNSFDRARELKRRMTTS